MCAWYKFSDFVCFYMKFDLFLFVQFLSQLNMPTLLLCMQFSYDEMYTNKFLPGAQNNVELNVYMRKINSFKKNIQNVCKICLPSIRRS